MASTPVEPSVIDLGGSSPGAGGQVDGMADWYVSQIGYWNLADDLMAGTTAMRAAETKYLTKFELESIEAFTARIKATVLTNFFKDHFFSALNIMFAEPLQVKDSKIPPEILANIDNQGHSVKEFAQRMAAKLLLYGIHHVLVDMPPNPGAQTLADDKANNLRPYWVSIPAKNVINAFADVKNNVTDLTQVRYLDQRTSVQGFSQTVTQAIRVLNCPTGDSPTTFETWLKQNDGPYQQSQAPGDSGTLAIKTMPWVTFKTFDDEFMVSPSIMLDIAHKNVEHWQSSSDQRNILTVSRYPIMTQIGTEAAITQIGPKSILHSPGNDAGMQPVKFEYIEPTGQAIQAGERDLDRIVTEANTLSIRLQTLTRKQQQTATGDVLDFSLSSSPLHMVATALEQGLNEALRLTALWLGLKPEDAGKVVVSREFGINANESDRITEIGTARRAGDLSLETYIAEMQNLGVLKTDINIDVEKQRIQAENTSLFAAVSPPKPPMAPKEPPPPKDAKAAPETADQAFGNQAA